MFTVFEPVRTCGVVKTFYANGRKFLTLLYSLRKGSKQRVIYCIK